MVRPGVGYISVRGQTYPPPALFPCQEGELLPIRVRDGLGEGFAAKMECTLAKMRIVSMGKVWYYCTISRQPTGIR